MTDMLVQPTVPGHTQAPVWVDEVDGALTCTAVTDVTHDVRTFTFELPGGAMLRFLPGQHLTLRLLVDGEAVERCYTISSAPTRPGRLAVTVKRVPGGPVSGWLHDRLRVGDVVRAAGPFGRFSHGHHPAGRYLFLTAGSGITPAMSMLRSLCDTGSPASIVFVHCARTPADIIFRDELDELPARHGITLAVLCEDDSVGERWRGLRGRVDEAALLRVAPDVRHREVFTCGPAPFMASVRELLDTIGVDPARAHEESFVLGAGDGDGTPAGDPPTDRAGTAYRLELRRSGRVVECDAGTTILQAAARAGVPMPSSCGEGVCGTCKLTLLAGRVDMQHAGGIRPREVAQDKILACCSRPLDDVVVDG